MRIVLVVCLSAGLALGSACTHARQQRGGTVRLPPVEANLPRPAAQVTRDDHEDIDLAMPRLLMAINEARAKHGAAVLHVDRGLALVAQVAAAEYQKLGRGFEQRVAAGANQDLRAFSLVFRQVLAMVICVDRLEQAQAVLQPALDPKMQYVGLTVASAPPPRGPLGGFAVVITLGE
jgi:hypothetical protein